MFKRLRIAFYAVMILCAILSRNLYEYWERRRDEHRGHVDSLSVSTFSEAIHEAVISARELEARLTTMR